MKKQKCLVLYSGGLDSRLVVRLMQEEGYDVVALHFNLPFCCEKNLDGFIDVSVIDCTKAKMLREYLEIIKKGEHGRGKGFNPCRACKIWMFRKAKEYADEQGVEVIASGEVLGQRPMSQTRVSLDLIDRKLGFEIRRPLIELGIVGRRRDKQRELAKKFGIDYPNPGGGCLLCEGALVKKFKVLLGRDLISEEALCLVGIGRHFFIDGIWMVVGRNEEENKVIEGFENSLEAGQGVPAVYFHDTEGREKAKELQKDYKRFEEFKL